MRSLERAFIARQSGFAGDGTDLAEVRLAQNAEEAEFVIWHPSTRMPALPSVSRVSYSLSESEHIISQLSEEEQNAAKESFSVYFKPVQLYNSLRKRVSKEVDEQTTNLPGGVAVYDKALPLFRRNCLLYKLKDKHKRRVQLSVSRSRPLDDVLQTLQIFPVYILLARPVPTPNGETLQSSCYRFKRACKLTASNGALTVGSSQARFILPEIKKLTEFKSGSLAILLVSFAGVTNQTEIDLTEDHMVSPSNEGYCLMGKTPVDFVHFSMENSPKISLGERAEFRSAVSLQSCYMKLSCSDGEKCLLFHHSLDYVDVPLTITAEELGANDILPLDLHSRNNISTDKLPQVIRPRTGEVLFNFRYYNNKLHRTEVTEDYTCPFCLLKCASYKGLQCHLPASHDLFNYEFWAEGDYQVVIVSAKLPASSSEAQIVGKKLDPKEKEFYLCHKRMRRRKAERKNQKANQAASDSGVSERMHRELAAADVPIADGPEEASPSVPGSSIAPTTRRRSARPRTSKLAKGHNARSQNLLEIRRFFHSQTAQPMAPEQVFAEEDSEGEIDDDIVDLEESRTLDEFVDVNQTEKRIMHLWNKFKRKQRVLADAHIPWACEAFSTQHKEDLRLSPELYLYWRLYLLRLFNFGLLDLKTIDNCNSIILNSQNPENKN